jgi:hypothetical protein
MRLNHVGSDAKLSYWKAAKEGEEKKNAISLALDQLKLQISGAHRWIVGIVPSRKAPIATAVKIIVIKRP